MTKGELIKSISEEMKITKKEAEQKIKEMEQIIEIAVKGEGKTKVCAYFTAEKVHKEEKKGVCNGKEFTVKPHDEIVIKRTQAAKRI